MIVLPFLVAGDLCADDTVDFGREIRPILSDHCFQCHGPDANQREADLRLDERDAVFAERDERPLIKAGDPQGSEIVRRIRSDDDGVRMPPPEFDRPLKPEQMELIERWIRQGADWQRHWSLDPPVRPTPPQTSQPNWCRSPIDSFVLARLEQLGMKPSPEADKSTLLRRVHLDLTGLPPTPEELDAFLADTSPHAYEGVVDRLLSSPRFGERMASVWLDAARYADTSGYQNDGPRSMWRWRDWVIEALNDDMPFDQFTIEQIAGDMLPDATLAQRIASGFNRNHRGNAEGGIIAEEYQVEYVVDRVDTTATVWLGLTMGCARCHDHKYDPITQKDFYRVFAFFNNVPENGRAVKEGNSPPFIKAPTRDQQRQLVELETQILAAASRCENLQPELDAELAAWEKSAEARQPADWQPTETQLAHFSLDRSSEPPAKVDVQYVPAVRREGVAFDGTRVVDAGDVGNFGYFDRFSLSVWVRLNDDRGGTVVSRMVDEAEASGWSLQIVNGRVQLNLVKRWLDDSIRVETETKLPPGSWHHIAATYDGSRVASGITIAIDGKPQRLIPRHDFLNQSFANDEPLRIGGGNGPGGRFHGAIDDLRLYRDVLTAAETVALSVGKTIDEIVATSEEERRDAERLKLRQFFVNRLASKEIRAARSELRALHLKRRELAESLPTVMVMQETPNLRETFVLQRGQYNRPTDKVEPGVPAFLPALPGQASKDRLGFAQWLVDRENPLSARVAVNRWWQMLFGVGLVETVEDFGTQGTAPSHPRLLDWLAVELMDQGWSTKHVLKTIVTSSTYRQVSSMTPQQRTRDPKNRLFARGPRARLSAGMIRDQALHISGLISNRIGGESVRPYQPDDLWNDIATDSAYVQSTGGDLYRRSLYTYWKRTAAPPNMMVLDATAREACTVRMTRTNTPLQALALMNDVTYVEAARVLAERILADGEADPAARLTVAFRRATSRHPTEEELGILLSALNHYRSTYRRDEAAATRLASSGEAVRHGGQDNELAAYTAVCSLILNLDETITKE